MPSLREALHRAALLSRYAAELVEHMLAGENPDSEVIADWLARIEDCEIETEATRYELAKLS